MPTMDGYENDENEIFNYHPFIMELMSTSPSPQTITVFKHLVFETIDFIYTNYLIEIHDPTTYTYEMFVKTNMSVSKDMVLDSLLTMLGRGVARFVPEPNLGVDVFVLETFDPEYGLWSKYGVERPENVKLQ